MLPTSNKNLFFLKTVFLMTAVLGIIASCKKFVEVPPSPYQISSSTVFTDSTSAVSATMGLYSQIMSGNLFFLCGAQSLYPGLSADELVPTSPGTSTDPFYQEAVPVNSSVIQNDIWRSAYQYIYQANLILEGLQGSKSLSTTLKNQLMGEALFVRALSYYYLSGLFGDVPLVLSTDYRENMELPRTPVSRVIEQMKNDLTHASGMLSLAYASPDRARANRWTAMALLARVELSDSSWADAENAASLVISSGSCALESLDHVFLATSKETIFQLKPVLPGYNSPEGNLYLPVSATSLPAYALSPFLLGAFEVGDGRKVNWVGQAVASGVTYYYPSKYKVKTATAITEYEVVLRLAEQYLIRAEARARQGNLSEALQDLNLIRGRAGLLPVSTADMNTLLEFILQERRVELFTEWGHRFHDLKRSGTIDQVLGAEKPSYWRPWAAWYPIPYSEILSNSGLTQNPGY